MSFITTVFASVQHAFSVAAMAIAKGVSLAGAVVVKAAPVLQAEKPLVDIAVGATQGAAGLAAENAAYALLGSVAAEIHAQQVAGTFDPNQPLTVEHSAMLIQGIASLVPHLSAELATVGVKVPGAVTAVAAAIANPAVS